MFKLRLKHIFFVLLIPFSLFIACDEEGRGTPQTERKETEVEATSDRETKQKAVRYEGAYCAEVHYYNPNTGTRSQYRLIIEAEDNTLERINFKKGYLDEDHFQTKAFDEQGRLSIITDRGYRYRIKIIGESAGCFEGME